MELEKKIAKAILRAAQIREESFDKASFNKAIEEAIDSYQERRKISLHALYPGIDASTFYKKDLATSCQEAAIEVGLPASLSYLLSLSFHDWNNMEGWARGISASELNGSWGGEIEDLPDLRSTLPDLCSVGDWKRARAKNLKDGYWGCACGSRKFNLLQSQENVKTICSKCGASDIIYWNGERDSSSGAMRRLDTGEWVRSKSQSKTFSTGGK